MSNEILIITVEYVYQQKIHRTINKLITHIIYDLFVIQNIKFYKKKNIKLF